MRQSTTTTRQTKACKIDRTIEVTLDHEPWGPTCYATVLEVRHQKTKCHHACDSYILERVRCDIGGIAVLVTKQDGGTNHCHLDDIIGESCTCESGVYTGKCRHLVMVKLALQLDLL